MTWRDVILYGPGWLACAVILLRPLVARHRAWKLDRLNRRKRERRASYHYRTPW